MISFPDAKIVIFRQILFILRPLCSGQSSCLVDLGLHGRVAPGELLDGKGVGLVVGQPEIVLGPEERLLDLLEMVDGLVNLLDGLLELLAGKTVVVGELVLEVHELVLEVGDIYGLAACDCQLLLVLDALA